VVKRKIIKQGNNTLTITLPAKWAQSFGLQPGNEIELLEQGNSLLLVAGSNNQKNRIELDISNLPNPIIWRYLLSAYRSGFDEIVVSGIGTSERNLFSDLAATATAFSGTESLNSSTKSLSKEPLNAFHMSPLDVVNVCVNRLVGMEIIDQKEGYCTIKDLGEVNSKEFDNALKRIFLLLRNESDTISKAFQGKASGLKTIHMMDTNLDRFEDFCFRVLNKKGFSVPAKTPTIYSTIFTLEMVGDEFKKIALHMLEFQETHSKMLKELFLVQEKQLQRFLDLFYKFEKKKVLEIFEADRSGTELIEKYYSKLNDNEKELLHHFKKIGIYILSLTELRIDLEY
jgi:phosphate uptake regulator